MSSFSWNPAWAMEVPAIDRQHRELVHRMELLATAIALGGEREELERTLLFLGDYIEVHFQTEEDLMDAYRYSGKLRHQASHDELRTRVKALVDTYLEGREALHMDVMDFLISWLVGHLAAEDRLLANHLRAVGGVAI